MGEDILDLPWEAKATDVHISKGDPIQLQSFHTARGTITKVKTQRTEWKEILANHVSDKGRISKICKQFLELKSKNKQKEKKKEKKQSK